MPSPDVEHGVITPIGVPRSFECVGGPMITTGGGDAKSITGDRSCTIRRRRPPNSSTRSGSSSMRGISKTPAFSATRSASPSLRVKTGSRPPSRNCSRRSESREGRSTPPRLDRDVAARGATIRITSRRFRGDPVRTRRRGPRRRRVARRPAASRRSRGEVPVGRNRRVARSRRCRGRRDRGLEAWLDPRCG